MTDYNDGNWHGWNGGKCPVHQNSEIDWMLRSGKPQASDRYAVRRSWAHFGTDSDIVAFRVTKVHREPREWWLVMTDGSPRVFIEEKNAKRCADEFGFDAIHVREALQ